jgi:putative DNA primase/helicase
MLPEDLEGAALRDRLRVVEPDLKAFQHHDAGNSERLVRARGNLLRFCHPMRKWLIWDGKRWAVDQTERAMKAAKQTMAATLQQAIDGGDEKLEKFARKSLDYPRLKSMLMLAQSELAILPEDLDRDPDLLNFQNCTLNLKTGETHKNRQGDHITKLVHYDHVPGARCDRFLAFIARIMGVEGVEGAALDRACETVGFLQRALGYSITGHTREKAVFIPLGGGNNGKTTLLALVAEILREYSALISVESLMIKHETVNSQADLADLRGARFVTTSEVEDGQTLAQARLKRLTQGGGRIKAVRKFENPIEFGETHKLWMDSNRRPKVRDADDRATFARLWPIPFDVEIPASEIDSELPLKLIGEAEGILAWLVDGARQWYGYGLGRPRGVDDARTLWKDEDDAVGRFIADCCVVGEGEVGRAGELYKAYVRWAESGREHPVSNVKFSGRLEAKRFTKSKDRDGALWHGVRLAEVEA